MRKHEPGRAIDDYSEAIKLEPKDRFPYLLRGYVWSRQGDHKRAVDDFDAAIRLAPNDFGAYISRAIEWEKDERPDRAISDYQKAISLKPRAAIAYDGRARIWKGRGEYDKVIASCAELARVAPEDPAGHRELAWLLATCEQAPIRDGRRALAEATTACERTKWADPRCLEAVAAASAECGDFDAAVKWQSRALEIFTAGDDLADRMIKMPEEAEMTRRLALYKAHTPFRNRSGPVDR